jgi:hypothetical protein
MMRGTSQNSNVVNTPEAQNYWFYNVHAKRDTGGGTAATLIGYGSPNNFYSGFTSTSSGAFTWAKHWTDRNDGSGSGLDADTVDGIQGASFLRSDADDTVTAGTTYTFGASDTEGLRFTNSSYNKSLYIGGWSGSNSSGISRIRNSNDNLHLDCGSAGNLYLNHYATGTVYIRGNTAWHAGNDGSGSGLDADLLDGNHATAFPKISGTNTYTTNGVNYFRIERGGYSGSLNTANLQAYSTGANSAFMSFHRSGYYAVNMGLDADNILRIGGWSASANRWVLDMNGNMTAAGNVTAYSDIRLKDNIEVIPNALEKVNQIRGVTFTRNDQENKEARHTGVIAQEVEKVLPEVISEDNLGIKNVAYGNMVGLLIEAMKEQQKQIDELKEKLENK